MEPGPGRICVALYLRMSTEHQTYSIDRQTAALRAYALARGYEIVRTYADAGLSGLRLEGRAALQRLLADVLGGEAGFSRILTYDVSRWGRFQDPDQGAHYEYICRQAGVAVEYCAEPFENDGSLGSVLVKQLKRAMAAEYSRDLSRRVSAGKRRARERGHWGGGPAPFGLRRQLRDADGAPRAVLERGDQKALQTQHVVLVPGPPAERAVVRRIFRMYADAKCTPPAIAAQLAAEGVSPGRRRAWSAGLVRLILRDELYVGRFVGNRYRGDLGGPGRKLPRGDWVTVEGFVAPILDPALFARAQRRRGPGRVRLTDAEMLAGLARLRGVAGALTSRRIQQDPALPGPGAFRQRFGSLPAAYAEVGARRTRAATAPRMGPFAGRLADLLAADQARPRPRPGTELFKVLRRAGYQGTLGTLRGYVRAWRAAHGGVRQPRSRIADEAGLLGGLARILAAQGRLDTALINADRDTPCVRIYARTFGGLRAAYRRVGYVPARTPRRPKLGPFVGRLEDLIGPAGAPGGCKPPTSAAIWRILVSEGFTGGPSVIETYRRRRG